MILSVNNNTKMYFENIP